MQVEVFFPECNRIKRLTYYSKLNKYLCMTALSTFDKEILYKQIPYHYPEPVVGYSNTVLDVDIFVVRLFSV